MLPYLALGIAHVADFLFAALQVAVATSAGAAPRCPNYHVDQMFLEQGAAHMSRLDQTRSRLARSFPQLRALSPYHPHQASPSTCSSAYRSRVRQIGR